MKSPKLTKEPLHHVDATPNEGYVLRILRAHLHNAECLWEVRGLDKKGAKIYDLMNEHCEQRAELLRKAISILNK